MYGRGKILASTLAGVTQVIVVNGGSSSGKSGIARCLRALLPEPWLVCAVDTLVDPMPAATRASDSGIDVADGQAPCGCPAGRARSARLASWACQWCASVLKVPFEASGTP